jgi:hypothetical protein
MSSQLKIQKLENGKLLVAKMNHLVVSKLSRICIPEGELMKTKTKAILLTMVLAIGLFTTACPKRTSIGDIETNPGRFYDKEVAVAGTVQSGYGVSIPIIQNGSGGVYKIEDGTGSIWVVTQKGVPSKGAQIGVKGKIQNGININGRNYGLVLIEDDRRFNKK